MTAERRQVVYLATAALVAAVVSITYSPPPAQPAGRLAPAETSNP